MSYFWRSMKKALYKSASGLLALMVLISTFSFTVDKHFCGGNLIDLAVFSKAKDCGMDMAQVPQLPNQSVKQTDGCSNQQILVKGQQELTASFDSLDAHQQVFLTAFAYSYFNLFEAGRKTTIPFQYYSPPLLVSDIQLEDQVFLI